jgi:hypothetical protein
MHLPSLATSRRTGKYESVKKTLGWDAEVGGLEQDKMTVDDQVRGIEDLMRTQQLL